MEIGPNTYVSLDYTVHTDQDEFVDSSEYNGPLEIVYGEGSILKALEKELEGLTVGDEKTVKLQPEDAYGEYDKEAVTELPREKFPEEQEIKKDMEFVAQMPDGEERVVRVKDVNDNEVTLDFNHPLAGKTLEFNIFVQEVREATEDDYKQAQQTNGNS